MTFGLLRFKIKVMEINPIIFGTYDIRGIYAQELTDEVAGRLGKAFGTFFVKNKIKKVVIGQDNRLSGSKIKKHVVDSLKSIGINVTDIGIVTTPMIYFAWQRLNVKGTVMVTASHNPPKYNGFKIGFNKQPLLEDGYQQIKKIAASGKFPQSKGSLTKYNLWPEYLARITQSVKLKKKLKIVVDCGNGTTGLFVKEFFEKLGCKMIGLYTKSDGSFPNHPPYPQKVEFYQKLIETVIKEKADLGLAFDGDGDRIGIYNEKGEFIPNDILTVLFIRKILKKHPGAKIVMNISTSLAVIDDAQKRGGKLILWKTGYPNISSKMKEVNAIFGGEISGHFFFADRYYGFDDAFYATARLLEIMAAADEPISKLFTDIPQFFTTPEFRVIAPEGPENNKFTIIKKITQEIKKHYSEAKILDFDGVRFSFKDGWGLIRASNTQPMLTGRAEAKTKEKLEEIKKMIKNNLAKHQIKLDWKNPITE